MFFNKINQIFLTLKPLLQVGIPENKNFTYVLIYLMFFSFCLIPTFATAKMHVFMSGNINTIKMG